MKHSRKPAANAELRRKPATATAPRGEIGVLARTKEFAPRERRIRRPVRRAITATRRGLVKPTAHGALGTPARARRRAPALHGYRAVIRASAVLQRLISTTAAARRV